MVYFVEEKKLNNYLFTPEDYIYNKTLGVGALQRLEVNYPFWILFNSGVVDIKLISPKEIPKKNYNDVIVFYGGHESIVDPRILESKARKIQIVTDTPIIEACDAYITYDPSVVERDSFRRWFHVMYPLPIGIKRCNPSWPPENICCISPESASVKELKYKKEYNFIEDSYSNKGDEDVFFHIRTDITKNLIHKGISSRMKFPSHKTANRLFQAWFCGVPSVLSSNPAMEYIKSSEYDFLEAKDLESLNYQIERLRGDRELFYKMKNNSDKRSKENSYRNITDQWIKVIEYFKK